MMELLEMVHALTPEGEQVEVNLITKSDMNQFSLANKIQSERLCKAFEVTYLKTEE